MTDGTPPVSGPEGDAEETDADGQWITATEAQRRLGLTKNKLAELLRYNHLPYRRSPIDGRVKLVPVRAVEELRTIPRAKRHDPNA